MGDNAPMPMKRSAACLLSFMIAEEALVFPKADFFPGSLMHGKPVHCPLTADAYRAGGGIVFQLVALENLVTFF